MLIKIEGKGKAISELERLNELLKEAQCIIYRLPTDIKITVEDGEKKVNCSQDTQWWRIKHNAFLAPSNQGPV